jgi:hypothetical protein
MGDASNSRTAWPLGNQLERIWQRPTAQSRICPIRAVPASRTISRVDYSLECGCDRSQIHHSDTSQRSLRCRSRQAIEIHPDRIALCRSSRRKWPEQGAAGKVRQLPVVPAHRMARRSCRALRSRWLHAASTVAKEAATNIRMSWTRSAPTNQMPSTMRLMALSASRWVLRARS